MVRAGSLPHGDERNPCLKLRQTNSPKGETRRREFGVDDLCCIDHQRHVWKDMSDMSRIDRYTHITPAGVKGTLKGAKEDPVQCNVGTGV